MYLKKDDVIKALQSMNDADRTDVFNSVYAAKEDTTYRDQLAAFNRSMKKVIEQGDFDQDAVAAALVNRLG